VLFLFAIRAAYVGFLTYASSEPDTTCGGSCDACQPVPALMYLWTVYNQQYAAICSAVSIAFLIAVSVWFMLAADEKHLLRTGCAVSQDKDVASLVQQKLHEKVGLHQLL
jgi:hypothetical protein